MKKVFLTILLLSLVGCSSQPIASYVPDSIEDNVEDYFGAAQVFATFNPSDKGSNITLSNGDLTATKSTATWTGSGVRSDISVSSGKWYWEYTLGASITPSSHWGVGTSTATLDNYLGSDAYGWAYRFDGTKYHSGSQLAFDATTVATSDVIGFALDMDAGTIDIYLNGSALGELYASLSGTFYAMATLYANTEVMTANFGATSFSYSVPSGYNSGLYTGDAPVAGGSNLEPLMFGIIN